MNPSTVRKGAAEVALAAFLFGLLGALVKALAGHLPSAMIVFFRNAVGWIALWPFLSWKEATRTSRFGGHLTRSLAGVASMYLSFYAIAHMRLADAYTLTYTAPLFIPFLAKAWLGDPIPSRAGKALALGFAGVVLMFKPGWGLFQPVALLALASGLLSAVAQVGIRQLTRTEPPARIVFYFGFVGTALTAPALPMVWTSPRGWEWVALGGLGAIATVAQMSMTNGYRHASPSDVGGLMYIAVAVAGAADALIWRRWPDTVTLMGMLLIMSAGLWILRAREPEEGLA